MSLRGLGKIERDEVNDHYICTHCGRQFIDVYNPPKGYSHEIKLECLKLYVNGMEFRAIERSTGVQTLADSLTLCYHTTIIYWVKQIGEQLPDAPEENEIPEVGELDELETFVGSKKTKFGYGRQLTTLGKEFWLGFWEIIVQKHLSLYGKSFVVGIAISRVTDGWKVYPSFIEPGDHIVSKIYMTRVVRAASPLGRR